MQAPTRKLASEVIVAKGAGRGIGRVIAPPIFATE
jgi:hypothetical protein